MDDVTYGQLREIERRDPDGDEMRTTPPGEADYAAHRAWAIGQYGESVWDIYAAGGWGREAGYFDGGAHYEDGEW